MILAPSTGKPGDCYNEQNIKKAAEDIAELLQNDELQLHVVQGSLVLREESLGGKNSNRPGTHTFWLAMSNTRDPKDQKNELPLQQVLLESPVPAASGA